jgi:hypothetical protein
VTEGGNWQRATIGALGPGGTVVVGYYPEHGHVMGILGPGSAGAYCRDSVGRWYQFVDRGLWPDPVGGTVAQAGELDRPPAWAERPGPWPANNALHYP